jgi:hypothetical protein
MGRAKTITPRKRAIIVQYTKDGLKQSEICKDLVCRSLLFAKLSTNLRAAVPVRPVNPLGVLV